MTMAKRRPYSYSGEPNYWGRWKNRTVWNSVRKKVVKRDKGRCRECSIKKSRSKSMHCHHIDPLHNAPLLWCDPNNLVLLCKDCHRSTYGRELEFKEHYLRLIGEATYFKEL